MQRQVHPHERNECVLGWARVGGEGYCMCVHAYACTCLLSAWRVHWGHLVGMRQAGALSHPAQGEEGLQSQQQVRYGDGDSSTHHSAGAAHGSGWRSGSLVTEQRR